MQTDSACVDPPTCLPGGPEGGKRGGGGLAPRPMCRTQSAPHGGPKGKLGQPCPQCHACRAAPQTDGHPRVLPAHLKSSPRLLVDSGTIPTNRADYSPICSNLKIKTDKVKIFREQCQAKGIKLLSDLYLSNGFMPFNNFKRNIMFFKTLF